jgi:hypothetical protein
MNNGGRTTTGEDLQHEVQLVRGRKTSVRLRDILADTAAGIRLAVFVIFGSVILAVAWIINLWDWIENR